MHSEVTELTVNPRRAPSDPVATIATPLARLRMASRNSAASTELTSVI
jgi:hypothetical protein